MESRNELVWMLGDVRLLLPYNNLPRQSGTTSDTIFAGTNDYPTHAPPPNSQSTTILQSTSIPINEHLCLINLAFHVITVFKINSPLLSNRSKMYYLVYRIKLIDLSAPLGSVKTSDVVDKGSWNT